MKLLIILITITLQAGNCEYYINETSNSIDSYKLILFNKDIKLTKKAFKDYREQSQKAIDSCDGELKFKLQMIEIKAKHKHEKNIERLSR